MKIQVDNVIRIFEPTKDIKQYCEKKLVLQNPDYEKLKRLGKWTGRTSEKIKLYERYGSILVLPFGCLSDVWNLYRRAPYIQREGFITSIEHINPIDYHSGLKSFDYQERAIKETLLKKNGVLVMPCGSGKTCVGLEVVARVGGRALWLTHTGELLRQSKKRAESIFDLPKEAFGTITEGKVDIGTHITFATVQTMCKLDLTAYKDCFDVIITDECQHCAGSPTRVTQFYKVMSSLSARYKIGLTATPKRADGLERSMFALLGDIICEIKRDDIPTCSIKIKPVYTGWNPDVFDITQEDGTLDYHALVSAMIKDEDRAVVVAKTIKAYLGTGAMIVLANRVEYLQKLCEMVGGRSICLSGAGVGKKAKEERKSALDKLNAGELDCVFATYQLSAEGLDVPQLRYVVFATPEKDDTKVTQSVGRVGRIAKDKKIGIVIDFVDDFRMYQSWYAKRKTIYKKLGAEIIE